MAGIKLGILVYFKIYIRLVADFLAKQTEHFIWAII